MLVTVLWVLARGVTVMASSGPGLLSSLIYTGSLAVCETTTKVELSYCRGKGKRAGLLPSKLTSAVHANLGLSELFKHRLYAWGVCGVEFEEMLKQSRERNLQVQHLNGNFLYLFVKSLYPCLCPAWQLVFQQTLGENDVLMLSKTGTIFTQMVPQKIWACIFGAGFLNSNGPNHIFFCIML